MLVSNCGFSFSSNVHCLVEFQFVIFQGSLVPIISCSTRRSSISSSLNRHFCACFLHLAINESTDSSSDCLKPCNWYQAMRKFDFGSTYVANLSKITSSFCFSSSLSSKQLKIFRPSSPIHLKIYVAVTFSSFWFKSPSKISWEYCLNLLNAVERSDPFQSRHLRRLNSRELAHTCK